MLDEKQLKRVKTALFKQGLPVFAVVDGAACPEFRFKAYDFEPEHACLWSGALEPDIQEVAPYLVKISNDSVFSDWLIANGWNKNWGIFVTTDADLKTCKRHLKKFLSAKSPEGKSLIFRFYDPRVFVQFKSIWTAEQMESFFNEITNVWFQSSPTEFNSVSLSEESSVNFAA